MAERWYYIYKTHPPVPSGPRIEVGMPHGDTKKVIEGIKKEFHVKTCYLAHAGPLPPHANKQFELLAKEKRKAELNDNGPLARKINDILFAIVDALLHAFLDGEKAHKSAN